VSGYKNLTDPKTEWVPVTVPTPQFNGAADVFRWTDAVRRTKREAGEGIARWLERVAAAAKTERQAGEDD
jgi:hypothetical protein